VTHSAFVIVGLGFIGGSLAARIRRHFPRVRLIGISRDRRKISAAKRRKWIDAGFTHPGKAFHQNPLDRKGRNPARWFVLICTPVDVTPKLISEVDRYAPSGTVVTDVGSTKQSIARWASRKRFRRIQFVGSHPLAGSHLSGAEHARADLFKGAYVFVTPTQVSKPEAVRRISSFWRKLGTRVLLLTPEKHDEIVSQISHLPHAVASALMHAVSSKMLRYGASGFLDTTRVAQGDPRLWTPIFLSNRGHLLKDLGRFESALQYFISALRGRRSSRVARFLRAAGRKRRESTSRRKESG